METNIIKTHKKFMQRCLELAKLAHGTTYPNPMVGSVVVHNNIIIGEGYHKKAGMPHAEVNAIDSVEDKSLLSQSTIYVNLEPCAHYGKTPPCAEKIISCNIPRVVIGCIDSFSEVAGKGIEMLKNAGIEVTCGILEEQSLNLNKRFFTFHNKKRPYIILKWAETNDGFIDIDRNEKNYGQPTWISNHTCKQLVHKWRTQEQSIAVAYKTAIKDNPQLTVRDWYGSNPIRILIDRKLKTPLGSKVFDKNAVTYVFNETNNKSDDNVKYVTIDFNKDIIPQILSYLWNIKVQSIIIEGGRGLLNSFIQKNMWDEARVFIGNKEFINGVKAPTIKNKNYTSSQIGDTELRYFKNM